MVICKKCGCKTVFASGSVECFYPDDEPYEDGIAEESKQEAIEAIVDVSIYYCEQCDEVVAANIEAS